MKVLTIIVPVYNQEDLVIRALESTPTRNDIEILVIDDCSTDNTLKNVEEYKEKHPEKDIRIIHLEKNEGLGNAKNVGYDNAKGIYINQLDSDDYLYTDKYNEVIDMLDGTDIVYMNLEQNDGGIFELTKESQRCLCSGCARFIRKEFLGDMRCPKIRAAEDWHLNEEMQKKPHTDKFTGITAYHYNFPREGSLYDQLKKGEIVV